MTKTRSSSFAKYMTLGHVMGALVFASSCSKVEEPGREVGVVSENAESPPSSEVPPEPVAPKPSEIIKMLDKEMVPAGPLPGETKVPAEAKPEAGEPAGLPFPEKEKEKSDTPPPAPAPALPPAAPGGEPSTGAYNPDPGAYSGTEAMPEPFYPEIVSLPEYGMDELPRDQELPRADVKLTPRILPVFDPKTSFLEEGLPANTIVNNNRWKTGYSQVVRYPNRETAETPYQNADPLLWHPYRQSILKGDVPILGQDVFLKITAASFTDFEARRTPTPSGISGASAGNSEFFGDGDSWTTEQKFFLTIDLFQGETEVFKPVNWLVRLQPVYNVNYSETTETNALQPDPRGDAPKPFGSGPGFTGIPKPSDLVALADNNLDKIGSKSLSGTDFTGRLDDKLTLQEGFVEFHIADLSDTYDFISSRSGYQTFNSDFRGLIFRDTNLGYRLFGNAENNLWQYNLAYFDEREKDTNSGLNTFEDRNQDVFIANLYRQDCIFPGYTAGLSTHVNLDRGLTHYDTNGFNTRPANIGASEVHDVRAFYFGWVGEGKLGRVNVSHSFYQVVGQDELNGISGKSLNINAQQAHFEVSYDRDWIRYKLTTFYASGDSDPNDGTAGGFDTITENPNLFGGPFSYWVRQGFNLAGSLVGLKQRSSLIPNLRTSKFEGQSNFVNPGIFITGVGTDLDLTPELKLSLNANYVRFADTSSIKATLQTDEAALPVGYDLNIGIVGRPLLTDNIIVAAGFGAFVPEQGFSDIYDRNRVPVPGYNDTTQKTVEDFYYSAFVSLSLIW